MNVGYIKNAFVMIALIKMIISIHPSPSYDPKGNGSFGYSGNYKNIFKVAKLNGLETGKRESRLLDSYVMHLHE